MARQIAVSLKLDRNQCILYLQLSTRIAAIVPVAAIGTRQGERQLVSCRGASSQLANLTEKASWKLAPRVNSHLPLA